MSGSLNHAVPSTKHILVAEDEMDLVQLLRFNLQREGYKCRCASDGNLVMAEVQRQRPDLVILDRMLPGISGDEIAARLKRDPRTAGIPILMLTAKAEETDELVGFALGADDYVTKPFSIKVLLARVAVLLRRSMPDLASAEVISSGPIRLDADRHEVTVADRSIALTATEFKVLRTLMASEGRVLQRSRLLDLVMGTGVAVTERTIDVHVTALRKKLGDAASWIQTVRGVGYTFREPTD